MACALIGNETWRLSFTGGRDMSPDEADEAAGCWWQLNVSVNRKHCSCNAFPWILGTRCRNIKIAFLSLSPVEIVHSWKRQGRRCIYHLSRDIIYSAFILFAAISSSYCRGPCPTLGSATESSCQVRTLWPQKLDPRSIVAVLPQASAIWPSSEPDEGDVLIRYYAKS